MKYAHYRLDRLSPRLNIVSLLWLASLIVTYIFVPTHTVLLAFAGAGQILATAHIIVAILKRVYQIGEPTWTLPYEHSKPSHHVIIAFVIQLISAAVFFVSVY